MRSARVVYVLGLLIAADSVAGADKCEGISDIAGQAAIAKPAIVSTLKKEPQKGTLGEPWRYLWFIQAKDLDALGVPSGEQQSMFKTIVALNFSQNPEVNYDIFRDYYYLKCKRRERGLSSIPLESIPKASLVRCWDTVSNRAEFQACEEKLMESKSKRAR